MLFDEIQVAQAVGDPQVQKELRGMVRGIVCLGGWEALEELIERLERRDKSESVSAGI